MSITLPCCHLAKRASLGNRTLAFRLLNSSIQAEVPFSRFVTRARKTTSLQIHSRSFTLPDLSKFAPFGSSGSKSNCDTYHETVDLPFSKDLLFKIVSDVNQYHQFVPYCVESKIDASSEKLINKETREFLANLAIGYGQFRESYTSKVIIIDGKSVQATAIPTPLFKRLETVWKFSNEQSNGSTKVDFTIHYSFNNPLYAAFAKSVIEKMTKQMVNAFKQHAKEQQQA